MSIKGSASTRLQTPLAETEHPTPGPRNEGATVSRHMASSLIIIIIRSGPEGARGVFKSKVNFPIFYFSIDVFSFGSMKNI